MYQSNIVQIYIGIKGEGPMKLRVSAVQYHLEKINSFEEFAEQVTHHVRTAAEYDSEFVLFPEFFTTQLLSISDSTVSRVDELPEFTEQYIELFKGLAKDTGMHIIGGTHVVRKGDKILPIYSIQTVVLLSNRSSI